MIDDPVLSASLSDDIESLRVLVSQRAQMLEASMSRDLGVPHLDRDAPLPDGVSSRELSFEPFIFPADTLDEAALGRFLRSRAVEIAVELRSSPPDAWAGLLFKVDRRGAHWWMNVITKVFVKEDGKGDWMAGSDPTGRMSVLELSMAGSAEVLRERLDDMLARKTAELGDRLKLTLIDRMETPALFAANKCARVVSKTHQIDETQLTEKVLSSIVSEAMDVFEGHILELHPDSWIGVRAKLDKINAFSWGILLFTECPHDFAADKAEGGEEESDEALKAEREAMRAEAVKAKATIPFKEG